MEIQRINRSSPERIFMTFKNSDTTTISAGHWAGLDMVTDKDGVGVDKPAGKLLNKIVGVALENITAGSYGKFQVWGYNSNVRAKGGTQLVTGNDLTAGSPLAILVSGFYPTRFIATSANMVNEIAAQGAIGYVMGCSTAANYSASTSSTYTVFITCL